MGIVVSFISLSIDKTVADIQKEQLELQHLLNMPVFNVSSIRHREVLIVLENSQRFLKSYSYYNANRKSFTIKSDFDNRYIELKNYLFNTFKEQNLFILIDTIDYINIQYSDIEHNFHNEWYKLNGDELLFRQPEIGNYQVFLEINTMENEEVYNAILNILNEINQ